MRKQLLLEGPQPQEEIEAEILLRVERIALGARNFAVHDDGRQGARRQGAVAEVHVAVAALEARLVLHGYLGIGKPPACLVGQHVVQARTQVARMCAAAHRFAVRREDQRLDSVELRLVKKRRETVIVAARSPTSRRSGR